MISTAFKSSVPVVVFGGALVGIEPNAMFDSKVLLTVGMFVFGMIGTAAVLRSDVKRHDQWINIHNEKHEQLTEILSEIRTLTKEFSRRIEDIERHPLECHNFKLNERRVHDDRRKHTDFESET